MTTPARSSPAEPSTQLARPHPLPHLPVMLNVKDILPHAPEVLRSIESAAQPAESAPAKKRPARGNAAVLRGIKDLHDLQKQTLAVLESVKGSLDEIQQVLRSPEATRGMEKQQNAAMLLAKGFHHDALEQAQGAVALLPANPEAYLLLSLSLAADAQFDASLLAAQKGLALVDRRRHPLAIECGLLHALSALGCAAEALDRWASIIDSLPLPVLFEQMRRIASCFPAESLGGGPAVLDDLLNRRLARDEQSPETTSPRSRIRDASGVVQLRPDEIPAPTLFAGLDAAHEYQLPCTHRAVLAQVARRLQLAREPGDVVKFLAECVVPLGNRALDRSAGALARASVKRMLKHHADVMTLHRSMAKLEMAGTKAALKDVAGLLLGWRRALRARRRARFATALATLLALGGIGLLSFVLLVMNDGGMLAGKSTLIDISGHAVDALWGGPAVLLLAGFTSLFSFTGGAARLVLPEGRGPLTLEERRCLKSAAVKQSVRAALSAR